MLAELAWTVATLAVFALGFFGAVFVLDRLEPLLEAVFHALAGLGSWLWWRVIKRHR